jgi:hypothetical protein
LGKVVHTFEKSGTRCSGEDAMLATSLSRNSRSPKKCRYSMTVMAERGERARVSAVIRSRMASGNPSMCASAKLGAMRSG